MTLIWLTRLLTILGNPVNIRTNGNCIFARSTAILGIPVGQFKGLQPGNSLVGTLYAINIFFSLNPGSKGTSNHYQKVFSNKGRVTMNKD